MGHAVTDAVGGSGLLCPDEVDSVFAVFVALASTEHDCFTTFDSRERSSSFFCVPLHPESVLVLNWLDEQKRVVPVHS